MNWHKPFGDVAADGYAVSITPDNDGWKHTGLLVAVLDAGESHQIETGDDEYVIVPLAGTNLTVESDGDETTLLGRSDVFTGPTDVAYVPRHSEFTITASEPSRVALAFAPAASDVPFQVIDRADVPVELRGAGNCSREVRNFGLPDVLAADSIICCEVVTPSGNWSSYPPHKHDEHRPGEETKLEEIYYFEAQAVNGAPNEAEPHGFQVVQGTTERPIEVNARVHTGDVVLVPHGWHGPSIAAPGYDLYYLNVMAGPGPERAWRICDDPRHGWVRQTWQDQPIDPRLPFSEMPHNPSKDAR